MAITPTGGNKPKHYPSNRFSVAPMLSWTDRHCRYFHRLLSSNALLYTEMVTTGAILYGKGDYLENSNVKGQVSLQLGGSNSKDLVQSAVLAKKRGFSEINLNVGCPSDRVQNGKFGACLMHEGKLVADITHAIKEETGILISIKSRIGVDNFDSYQFLTDFVGVVASKGADTFIVHARKAWLSGLSPKENRKVPPLNYQRVYQLKKDFPELIIAINGGVKTLDECHEHLKSVDGVMMGREAYSNPFILSCIDNQLFGEATAGPTRFEILEKMYPYIEQQLSEGASLNHIARHMLGLFQGEPGARSWRRYISENGHKPNAGIEVLEKAAETIFENERIFHEN